MVLKKKEETSGSNREVLEGRSLEGYFFFITQNPPNLMELENCIG
jgi:DNA helicase HerA-like ATPase